LIATQHLETFTESKKLIYGANIGFRNEPIGFRNEPIATTYTRCFRLLTM